MSEQLSQAQREVMGRINDVAPRPPWTATPGGVIHHQEAAVRAWQHATDPDRVLLVWPDGNSMVVNAGRYIEDEPKMEPPDNWQPIGKHPTGTLRRKLAVGVPYEMALHEGKRESAP